VSDLNQVVAFNSVAQEGSFTAAARALGLAKSTVSDRVAALEARLGVQLMQRTTRTMRLTDDGAAYHERCRRALGDLRAAELALLDRGDAPQGILRVTAPRLFGHVFLGGVISAYLARCPGVQVELMLAERLVADRPGLRWPFVGQDGPMVFEGAARLLVNSLAMAMRAAIEGSGIAWLPAFLAQAAISEGRLRPILGDLAPPPLPIYALTPGGRFLPARTREFLDLLTAHVAETGIMRGAFSGSQPPSINGL